MYIVGNFIHPRNNFPFDKINGGNTCKCQDFFVTLQSKRKAPKIMDNTSFKDMQLSAHFRLSEFLNLSKYPGNIPTEQDVANLTYGCLKLLEPARLHVGPIIVNSGYRNEQVNRRVGGVKNSQHLTGQAADIRPRDPAQFHLLVAFLRANPNTDQLLSGNGWLHISWAPFTRPRHYVRIGYYK